MISLGANCYPKAYIDRLGGGGGGETNLFDYLGTSMWSINRLLVNDFTGLVDPANFQRLRVIDRMGPVVVNTEYYIRFPHYLKSVEEAAQPDFQAQLARRIARFKALLSSKRDLECVRIEEDRTNRIPHKVLQEHSTASEYSEVERFVGLVRELYETNATVLYFTTDTRIPAGWNAARTIRTAHLDTLRFPYAIAGEKLTAAAIESSG